MNTVEPIRDRAKIDAMKKVLKSESLRNYLLFVMGVNTGLRVSDLLELRVSDVWNTGKPREVVTLKERKTGKARQFRLNQSTSKAIIEYMGSINLENDCYLFVSRKGHNRPISRIQAWEILNSAAKTVGISEKIGTHTLRKTFGYHAYQQGIDITLLQKVFNHSAPSITLRYIGITQDDIDQVYFNLNL